MPYVLLTVLPAHDYECIFLNELLSEERFSNEMAKDIDLSSFSAEEIESLKKTLISKKIDHVFHPTTEKVKRILIADMESTIIAEELLDEMAEKIGVGDKVKSITEQAMQGILDFEHSIKERVSLFKGQPVSLIEEMRARITINEGAFELVSRMKEAGAYTALVSGGFTDFVAPVAQELGFDCFHANQFEKKDGFLTGNLIGPLVDRETKAQILRTIAQEQNIPLESSIAIGDGSNDVAMLKIAGLGIAYRGKPFTKEHANGLLDHADFQAVLKFQGL